MHTSTDRILTTHTGSLPRPEELTELMHRKMDGKLVDEDQLAAAIEVARANVLDKQLNSGVDVVSDGEVSKPSYVTYVTDRFDGFGGEAQPLGLAEFTDYPETMRHVAADPGMQHAKAPYCMDKVTLRDTKAVHADIAAFKKALQGYGEVEGFMTAASPGAIAMYMINRYYRDDEEYLYALADAMKYEYQVIVDSGLVLQIDCPDIGCAAHLAYKDLPLHEIIQKIEMHIEVINHAVGGLPPDRMRMHICWGNYLSTHHRDIELKNIAAAVLRARPQGLLVEASNPRHAHEWAVLKEIGVPDGKILIPGVIDSKTNYIEHPELIAQRISNYAGIVGRENVLAGSDCGFGTLVGMNWVSPRVVWAKLASLAEGARLASNTLWGKGSR
ncbi:cobalamin-independent methionine synthase II family protein [Protofrankia symbiont of Coriaria ruscifolia]|uniref:cobalamin-independent methionine synthase II family protein n=1 Tax=Protofrankia symbiont of Coriaria ruscifolia TaxID=1306542 RepID=UPI0010419737|nr:cobalamin-independent methionine synthase II family protein [Protofrankia symbiont of Coriaria ruscifolia]